LSPRHEAASGINGTATKFRIQLQLQHEGRVPEKGPTLTAVATQSSGMASSICREPNTRRRLAQAPLQRFGLHAS